MWGMRQQKSTFGYQSLTFMTLTHFSSSHHPGLATFVLWRWIMGTDCVSTDSNACTTRCQTARRVRVSRSTSAASHAATGEMTLAGALEITMWSWRFLRLLLTLLIPPSPPASSSHAQTNSNSNSNSSCGPFIHLFADYYTRARSAPSNVVCTS
jgi:hypothetical protein